MIPILWPLTVLFLDRGSIGKYSIGPDSRAMGAEARRFELIPGESGSFAGVLNMSCASSEFWLVGSASVD